jgi:hypothetical protein
MMSKSKAEPSTWPPAALALPDTVEEIEAGRPEQRRPLLPPDDSKAGRLARLLGGRLRTHQGGALVAVLVQCPHRGSPCSKYPPACPAVLPGESRTRGGGVQ